MKKLLLALLIICACGAAYGQHYQAVYTPPFDMISFHSKVVTGEARKKMYYIPRGFSGAPCAVMDPQNSNTYRLLHTGQAYQPYNGMLARFVCNDINGGCYAEPWDIIGMSRQDTNMVIGYSKVNGSVNSTNCNTDQYITRLSSNGGTSTTALFTGQEVKGFDIDPNNDNNIYFAILQYIYKSTNRGANFNIVSGIATLDGFVKVNPQNSNIVFAKGSSSMLVSTNSGTVFTPLTIPPLNDIAFDGGTNVYGVAASGVFKSTNSGLSWSQISSIQNVNVVEVNPDNPSIIYIGTNSGVYRSINGGATFNQQGYLFPISSKIIGLSKDAGSGDTIFICTDKAIFEVWDLLTITNEITNTVPTQYKLHENYPNPFNPSTNISFDIPERSDVSLVIYDGMGKQVAELTSSTLITGKYTYTWDAPDRSSGVYYARFIARGVSGNEYMQTTKMLLLK